MRLKPDKLVICALFAAITAVFSQIIIPISIVPISLASFAVMICGGVLGTKYGTLTTALYVLIGALGIPVFSGFKGGVGILLAPSGGFIIGYLFIAFISGLAFSKQRKTVSVVLYLCLANIICYTIGVLWYMLITKAEFATAIYVCVLPFIIGDAIKIAVAYPVIVRIKKQI